MVQDTKGIIEILREQLQPKGTSNIVRLSATLYMDAAFIQRAIDELEQKARMASVDELYDFSRLDMLAIQLLKDSAEL